MKTVQMFPIRAREHASDSRQRPYRLWYTIEVQASTPPPERTLEVTCAAHSCSGSRHGGDESHPWKDSYGCINFIEGVAWSGEPTVILHPRQQVAYHVIFIVLLDKNVQQFCCKSRAVIFDQYKWILEYILFFFPLFRNTVNRTNPK